MPDVMEDTLILLDVDLSDEVPCGSGHPSTPIPPATHRGVPPCAHTILLCTTCAEGWNCAKLDLPADHDVICSTCKLHFPLGSLIIEPLRWP